MAGPVGGGEIVMDVPEIPEADRQKYKQNFEALVSE